MIYDKIHKLSTDDYRYTNKLITSLNNTKEYILSQYGSYESLSAMLNQKQHQHQNLAADILKTKERMDTLKGVIGSINNQNPGQEIIIVNNQINAYNNVVSELGSYDPNMYDKLVEEQMELNASLNSLRSERTIIKKDIDVLYDKKNDINNTILASKRASDDLNNMLRMKDDLVEKIKNINIELSTQGSSSYYKSMIQLAQAINDMCTEIQSCLNEKHLKLFTDMICDGVDISAFLLQEGSVLLDSEKEMSAVARVKSMIETVRGEWVDDKCPYTECIHRKTYNMLDTYFRSYQSTTESQYTQYDLEQIDHAYKNVQTIRRLLHTDVPAELIEHFKLTNILGNVECKRVGIDVSYITYLMEEAAKNELKNQYVNQLTSIDATIEKMQSVIIPTDNMDDAINGINKKIDELLRRDNELGEMINDLTSRIDNNDHQRLMLSQIKHINIADVSRRKGQLDKLINDLNNAQIEYDELSTTYNEQTGMLNVLSNELKILSDAHTQYNNTMKEIENHTLSNDRYKVIAEATSSTKGKPVIAIRDTVNNALMMTNRLLDIMYDGEIELLEPTIDESNFTLPFRCGSHTSSDIRYGSQSESTLLSFALELSIVSSLTPNIYALVDEIDAALDTCDEITDNLNKLTDTLDFVDIVTEKDPVDGIHETPSQVVSHEDTAEVFTAAGNPVPALAAGDALFHLIQFGGDIHLQVQAAGDGQITVPDAGKRLGDGFAFSGKIVALIQQISHFIVFLVALSGGAGDQVTAGGFQLQDAPHFAELFVIGQRTAAELCHNTFKHRRSSIDRT